jgi:Ca2+/Na+ antiporter
MGLPVSIILFIVLFFAILVSSVLIAHVVDVLQKKVNIGGPLIAGVMLAIVTSIPEIIICFIAAFDKDMGPSAVMGDVYGGLLLHTAALGIITLLFYKSFKAAKTTKVELINFGTLVVLYALYLLSVFSKSEAAL